jgi:hypothetical protein
VNSREYKEIDSLATLSRPGASMVNVSPASTFAIDVPDALLVRARRGEAGAYEQLYRLFERPVYTLALRLTGQREEAQDILQETMLKLFDRLSAFRGDSPFWGWLRQIAVNESLMKCVGEVVSFPKPASRKRTSPAPT